MTLSISAEPVATIVKNCWPPVVLLNWKGTSCPSVRKAVTTMLLAWSILNGLIMRSLKALPEAIDSVMSLISPLFSAAIPPCPLLPTSTVDMDVYATAIRVVFVSPWMVWPTVELTCMFSSLGLGGCCLG